MYLLLCNHSGNQYPFIRILDFYHFTDCGAFGVLYMEKASWEDEMQSKVVKGILFVLLGVVLIYGVGTLLSSPIVNAKKYQKLLTVKDGEFTKDIEELSFDQIPLLDKDSATILGNRKMGSMVDMVSQFEVDDIYTQINYRDKPVRVSPLRYANPIKWLTNQSEEFRHISELIWRHRQENL